MKLKKAFLRAGILIAALSLFLYCQNNWLSVGRVELEDAAVPEGFDGYTIVHLSDLHNKRFGRGQARLLNIIREQSPDIIAVTGDLIDSRRPGMDAAMELIEGAVRIAPVYYVTGNHESRVPERYSALKALMEEAGVVILHDEAVYPARSGQTIQIFGMPDPTFYKWDRADFTLLEREARPDMFTLLLAHRPELIDRYSELPVNLALSGHAHGGQIYIPFIGALIAPGQGFFPKYTSGLYKKESTGMVVSRGLGNSLIPIRLFNRPEVVVVTLKRV